MSTLEERVAALEAGAAENEVAVTRLEAIVEETDAGRYTKVVEQLMADNGWDAATATANFNALLNSPEVRAAAGLDPL